MSRAPAAIPPAGIQYAALPWRLTKGVVEILLITTRNTRRWIVPKGWPLAGHSPWECAAFEALEEAGVSGEIATDAIGTFRYRKQRKSGEFLSCEVHVFAMRVEKRRRTWPEKRARESCWCSLSEALERVSEAGLRRLLSKFAKSHQRSAKRPALNRTP